MERLNLDNGLQEQVDDIIKNTSALREVTYKYVGLKNDAFFNETIFIDYTGLPKSLSNADALILYIQEVSYSDQGFFEEIKKTTQEKLDRDISILKKYLQECEQGEKSQIELQIVALEFTKNSLDFELELAGYTTGLDEDEIDQKLDKQYELDEKLFGPHVSKDPEFILESYAYTSHLLDEYGNSVSSQQKQVIEEGLDAMLQQACSIRGVSKHELVVPSYNPPVIDSDFEALSQIEIPQDDYVIIFDIFFGVSDVPQRSELGNYNGFYDGDGAYGVPKNRKGYETKTVADLMEIGPHEAGHYINLKVTRDRKDNKHPGDNIKEEGLAMTTQSLISGGNLEEMSYMTFAGPSVVMSGLYGGERYEGFQDAYLELLGNSHERTTKGDVIGKTLRKKRGFHKKRPGGTNKDAAYPLGVKGVLEYVREEKGDIGNLFGGKISLDGVRSGEFKPDDFGNKYINHILLAEVILFYLKNRGKLKEERKSLQSQLHDEGNENYLKALNDIFHKQFVVHLKDKYKYLADSFGLFTEAERFVSANRMKIMRIIGIINKHNTNNVPSNDNSPDEKKQAT